MSKKNKNRQPKEVLTKNLEVATIQRGERRDMGINKAIGGRFDKINTEAEKELKEGKANIIDVIKNELVLKAVESNQLIDPFTNFYSVDMAQDVNGFQILEPPFNPSVLKQIPIQNNVLLQCIDAMALNIEETGYTFEYVGPSELEDKKDKGDIRAELDKLEAFVSAPNELYSLQELRKRTRIDRETFGYAFIEVIRDLKNQIQAIYHMPAHNTRVTNQERDGVLITYPLKRGNKIENIQRSKRYRRYAQVNCDRSKTVYFKEFGDTRIIDSTNGRENSNTSVANRATEVIMLTDYRVGTLYGYPRWVNEVPAILGSRESELMNLSFFKDNGIPAMAVLCAGGELGDDAINAIETLFNKDRGRKAHNKIIVIEAFGDPQAANQQGQIPVPQLELKALGMERQQDGLFQEYDQECQKKVRSAFRIPPIILGLSDDYTLATADASLVVAESQVFQPERNAVDELINKYFLGDGINMPTYWRFKSNPTRMVNDEEIANGIKTLNDVGALTANDAINIGNKLFGLNVNQIEEEWGNVPYSLVMKLIEKGHKILGLEKLVEMTQQTKNTDTKTPAQDTAKKVIIDLTNNLTEAVKNVGSD